MPVEQEQVIPRLSRLSPRLGVLTFSSVLIISIFGCRLPLNDSVLALDAATAPVVDQAAATYREANALHNLRIDYDAVTQFDAKDPVYNPRKLEVLLSDKDIEARLAVLEAFQVYTKSLCAITSGTNPKELGEASSAVGGELSSVVNTLAPSIDKALGIAAGDGSTVGTAISPDVQNGISTGLFALGKFLVNRKIKNELPGKIAEMDPHVQALAKVLENDIDVLQDQERRDYDRIINLQTLYIRESSTAGQGPDSVLGPDQRRREIMKLPGIVRKQRAADEKLSTLRAAIVLLAQTHQQLTADAQNKNPESFKEKLQDLANAAKELGTFYSSLSAE
jgi:hypothetical protein